MLSSEIRRVMEEWPGSGPSLQAIPIQWLASVPSFCCPLLFPKEGRSSSHTAVCGQRYRLAPDFFVLRLACTPPGQNVQEKKRRKKKATALGNNSCEELVLNTACSVSENTYSRSIRTNRGEMHLRSSPGTRLSRIAFNSATVLWMVWVGTRRPVM